MAAAAGPSRQPRRPGAGRHRRRAGSRDRHPPRARGPPGRRRRSSRRGRTGTAESWWDRRRRRRGGRAPRGGGGVPQTCASACSAPIVPSRISVDCSLIRLSAWSTERPVLRRRVEASTARATSGSSYIDVRARARARFRPNRPPPTHPGSAWARRSSATTPAPEQRRPRPSAGLFERLEAARQLVRGVGPGRLDRAVGASRDEPPTGSLAAPIRCPNSVEYNGAP